MEGWRITCPICAGALEDFRLYRRLFRADPSGVLLTRFGGSARKGEQVMDRASRQRGVSSAYDALMRSLLFPQARTGTREAPVTPRLLNLVVPEAAEFFHRLPAENWLCSSRLLPLSVRIPVLAGVAVVSSCPDYWLERLLGAAMPVHQGLSSSLRRGTGSCRGLSRTCNGGHRDILIIAAIMRISRSAVLILYGSKSANEPFSQILRQHDIRIDSKIERCRTWHGSSG